MGLNQLSNEHIHLLNYTGNKVQFGWIYTEVRYKIITLPYPEQAPVSTKLQIQIPKMYIDVLNGLYWPHDPLLSRFKERKSQQKLRTNTCQVLRQIMKELMLKYQEAV